MTAAFRGELAPAVVDVEVEISRRSGNAPCFNSSATPSFQPSQIAACSGVVPLLLSASICVTNIHQLLDEEALAKGRPEKQVTLRSWLTNRVKKWSLKIK
ncbi:hypothetical protein E2C01_006116 [Portunus trituberculatus]|uniref:Uncharacterized protein n=1 Tax=Portunus trituberculatus TaxID=210409 RepID=A0A5B7CW84_PORTR|nr:hypothetical protein [Portunus trituberculatus]